MKILELFLPGILKARMKFLLTSIFLCASVFTISHAQTTGGSLVIGSGAVLTSTNDLVLQSGAALDVQSGGTLILKKNLSNQNTAANSLGAGLIELSGSTAQAISGLNILANLTLNNPEGLTVAGNTRITGTLTLTSGIISLGSNNLTLGSAATISGTPSATKMIVATGTGELRKEFSATGSFTYPVGDNTSTAEYSPVTLNFTSATFGSGAYAGVNLVNEKYPDDSITGSYLNRYWKVTQTGITGFNCNATFKYNYPADVTGTESQLNCVRVDPWTNFAVANTSLHQLTASGLTSFSTFTATKGQMLVTLTAFLEGPYDPGTNTMTTSLNDGGWIPITHQPYNGSPWNYSPAQAVASIPANVVDWVLIELRQGTTADDATYLTRKAAFIKKDGSFVNADGSSPLRFNNVALSSGNSLYPLIRHRNHMAILSNSAAFQNPDGSYTFDFSPNPDKVYGGAEGYVLIDSSPVRWGMPGGDANADNNIWGNDYTEYWVPTFFYEEVYEPADFNLDGNVWGNDYTELWIKNYNLENPLP